MHGLRHAPAPRHGMSVDVEDWFQVQAFAGCIQRADWEGLPRRVEANMDRILSRFGQAGVHATFFTLGWIAERHPGIVRRIVADGHELASHGYGHARVDSQDPAAFGADIRHAKQVLEDIGGVPVVGTAETPEAEIGDRLLGLVAEARESGIDPEQALRDAVRRRL